MTEELKGYAVAPPEEIEEQPQEKAEAKKESMTDSLVKLCPGLTKEQVRVWQQAYGKVYATVLEEDPNEIFIYRSFTKAEHKQINGLVQGSAKSTTNEDKEDLLDELVVKRCLLWPQADADFFSLARGGTINMLAETIFAKSHFLPPNMVLACTYTMD